MFNRLMALIKTRVCVCVCVCVLVRFYKDCNGRRSGRLDDLRTYIAAVHATFRGGRKLDGIRKYVMLRCVSQRSACNKVVQA